MVRMAGKTIAFVAVLAVILVTAVSFAIAAGGEPRISERDLPAISTARVVEVSPTMAPSVPGSTTTGTVDDGQDALGSEDGEDEEHEVVLPEVRDDDEDGIDGDASKADEQKPDEHKTGDDVPDGESSSHGSNETSAAPDGD